MDVLRIGARGYKVDYLQGLLNKAVTRDRVRAAPLAVDGRFGQQTDTALRAFQTRHRPLQSDGVAGRLTWNALGLREETEHSRIVQFGQPTGMTCWSAAATMILGNQSVGSGAASLTAAGGLGSSVPNLQAFARSLGWQLLNYSPTVQELVFHVRRTPVWIGAGGQNWGHVVVLSGVFSDGDEAGDGTLFRIHDPWPPGVGMVYGSFANPITMFTANGLSRIPASLSCVLVPP